MSHVVTYMLLMQACIPGMNRNGIAKPPCGICHSASHGRRLHCHCRLTRTLLHRSTLSLRGLPANGLAWLQSQRLPAKQQPLGGCLLHLRPDALAGPAVPASASAFSRLPLIESPMESVSISSRSSISSVVFSICCSLRASTAAWPGVSSSMAFCLACIASTCADQ